MQNPLNRLKKLWALSKLDVQHLDFVLGVAAEATKKIHDLPGETYDITHGADLVAVRTALDDAWKQSYASPSGSPDKGEFLPDMTEEEVLDYERKERLGWKAFKLPWKN